MLVLAPETVAAEVLLRGDDGHWPAKPRSLGSGDTLNLDSIAFRCSLAELCDGIAVP